MCEIFQSLGPIPCRVLKKPSKTLSFTLRNPPKAQHNQQQIQRVLLMLPSPQAGRTLWRGWRATAKRWKPHHHHPSSSAGYCCIVGHSSVCGGDGSRATTARNNAASASRPGRPAEPQTGQNAPSEVFLKCIVDSSCHSQRQCYSPVFERTVPCSSTSKSTLMVLLQSR